MARPVTVTIPHKLSKAEARSRVEGSVDQFKAQMAAGGLAQMTHDWAGDRLNFHARMLGQAITGRVDVREDDLRIEVDLPAFLVGLADKIAGKLKKQGRLLLEKK